MKTEIEARLLDINEEEFIELMRRFDAKLLATGLWAEMSMILIL